MAVIDYTLIVLLLAAAIYFSVTTRFVQFRMVGDMFRLLVNSGHKGGEKKGISSFQAFAVSIASRVGTGNLAGVALAIAIGGPGAVFWMWIIALLGAATSFIESTLAQMYKVRGKESYQGGPAYYIQNGIGQRWWAVLFAVLITLTFGLAFNSVQSNTIAEAFDASFGIPRWIVAVSLCMLTFVIISGGIKSIAKVSQVVVPVMALVYIFVALVIMVLNIGNLPRVLALIVENAFGFNQAAGATIGAAITMGIKRGLFSNEAGEGSTPNVAATADVSHPVKQGLIQSLGVFTDTIIICTCTAFIILCSGVELTGAEGGIVLTQNALDSQIDKLLPGTHSFGSTFVSIAIFFFAFTSIIANYYYGETNLEFIRKNKPMIWTYRVLVAAIVAVGALVSLDHVWAAADVTMALMTICNLVALFVLGRQAIACMRDYQRQKREGRDPCYVNPKLECWKE